MSEPILLSTTAFGAASTCLKKYQYSQVERLQPAPKRMKTSIRRGIWLHGCLEAYHKGEQWPLKLGEYVQWVVERGVPEEQAEAIRSQVDAIMQGYIRRWASDQWKLLSAEQQYTLTTKGGDVIRATIDAVVRDKQGTWIVEHKSTSSIPSSSWRAVDPQTAIQYLVARANGIEVDGLLFNYLLTDPPGEVRVKKDGTFYASNATTTTEKFNEAILERWPLYGVQPMRYGMQVHAMIEAERARVVNDAAFFARYKVHRPVETVKDTARDLQSVLRHIRLAREAGHYPRAFHVIGCQRFCTYSELCATEYASGRKAETLRATEFVVEQVEKEGK